MNILFNLNSPSDILFTKSKIENSIIIRKTKYSIVDRINFRTDLLYWIKDKEDGEYVGCTLDLLYIETIVNSTNNIILNEEEQEVDFIFDSNHFLAGSYDVNKIYYEAENLFPVQGIYKSNETYFVLLRLDHKNEYQLKLILSVASIL